MIHQQNCKYISGLAPVSTGGAITPLTCDTLGWGYATCVVHFGVIGASAFTVHEIQESATDFSGTVITAYQGTGTAGNLRLPQGNDDGLIFVYGIPLGGVRKRYLQLVATAGATTLMSVLWILSRGNVTPNSTTERGVTAQVFG